MLSVPLFNERISPDRPKKILKGHPLKAMSMTSDTTSSFASLHVCVFHATKPFRETVDRSPGTVRVLHPAGGSRSHHEFQYHGATTLLDRWRS